MRREVDIVHLKNLANETKKVINDSSISVIIAKDNTSKTEESIKKTEGDIRYYEGRLSVINELLTLETTPLPPEVVAETDANKAAAETPAATDGKAPPLKIHKKNS